MYNILAITKKEFTGYFNSPIAYVVMVVFLGIVNILFFNGAGFQGLAFSPGLFLRGTVDMRPMLTHLPWIFIVIAPAITMKLWAEERKLGTLEILLTLPVRDYEAVLGKYLASFLFLALNLALTLSIPYTLTRIGNPDFGPIIGGYTGALLLGGVYLAVGLFASSLAVEQIVAFILGALVCAFLFIIGNQVIVMQLPVQLGTLLMHICTATHFENISRGVIDSRDVIYYLSATVFFLVLTNITVESRR